MRVANLFTPQRSQSHFSRRHLECVADSGTLFATKRSVMAKYLKPKLQLRLGADSTKIWAPYMVLPRGERRGM